MRGIQVLGWCSNTDGSDLATAARPVQASVQTTLVRTTQAASDITHWHLCVVILPLYWLDPTLPDRQTGAAVIV